jgi:signal transduction histidine kinase/HPt (histidine-containing phosphotransfer) domain-containing protein/BarA-like signal transduction histidine kinase
MPGMDGIEVLRQVKNISSQTEVIMITGHGGTDTAIQALRGGAFDYITKPINFDELEIALSRALEKQRVLIENKQMHEETRRQKEELEQKLSEISELRDLDKKRVVELNQANEQLRIAVEKADSASKAKGDFLANMSHEIRTPLNGIIGISELLQDTEITDKQREYLDMVKSSADILLTLINDILDFSKIEAGKLDLEPIDFKLRDSLGDTLKTLAIRAHKKDLVLAYYVQPDVPDALVGDPTRLRQIIVNLVGNAIKFTDRGEVVVHADLESQTGDGVNLHITVSDTGIGIPEEKQKLIFNVFTQADSSITREFGGTGLGLSISSQLVRMMNGKIWVESEENKGSTFHFTGYFGLKKATNGIPIAMEPVNLQNLPVLVVDDNATNRRILKDILTNWHMRPTVVDSGQSALEVLDRTRQKGDSFALMILDVNVPEMDGFTLAERLNASRGDMQAPIIILTSVGKRGDAAKCRELGISAYLIKPPKHADLLDAIEVILGKKTLDEKQTPSLITRHSLREKRRHLNILLVEDNEINQVAAVGLLQSLGHMVSVAENGREALIKLEKEKYDLIFMDIEMPVMDGFEATAEIRSNESKHATRIPIIAITAYAMKGDRERCMQAGMDDHISKPFTKERLIEIINRYLPDTVKAKEKITEPQPETSGSDSNGSILDLPAALEALDGKDELLKKMAGIFYDDMPLQLEKLRHAFADEDINLIRRQAHTIKGASAAIRANLLADAAMQVEKAAIEEKHQEAFELFKRLEPELEKARKALETSGLLDK